MKVSKLFESCNYEKIKGKICKGQQGISHISDLLMIFITFQLARETNPILAQGVVVINRFLAALLRFTSKWLQFVEAQPSSPMLVVNQRQCRP